MKSFFVQPVYSREDLRQYKFFLQYHGKGFTADGIASAPMDEIIWDVHKLKEQLEAEQQARKQAERGVKKRR